MTNGCNYLSDTYTPDLSSAAVMEARKWLKERKLGLGSKSGLGYGSHSLDLVTVPQVSNFFFLLNG